MNACRTVIDWAATGTMLQGIGTLVGALAVIAAAIIGANTFNKWRYQKVAERSSLEAERILIATYNVRRKLSQVRSPMMWAHETEMARKKLIDAGEWNEHASDSEQRGLATLQAYYNRLNDSKIEQGELEACQPMARALFGEELEHALEKLNHQFWSVKVYADANYRDKQGADVDFRKKIESTIWEGYPNTKDNEIDQIVEQSVTTIEKVCLPALRLEATR